MLIKELIARGDLERCLMVCPGSLAEQWQDELYRRFDLPFEILTNYRQNTARTGNWFLETGARLPPQDSSANSAGSSRSPASSPTASTPSPSAGAAPRKRCRTMRSSKAGPTEVALMNLDTGALQHLLCERLCEDVQIAERPDGALMLRTHFEFPDGDRFPIHVSEAGTGGVRLSDRGHTLMHVSYDHYIDSFLAGARGQIPERIVPGVEHRSRPQAPPTGRVKVSFNAD